MYAIRRFAVRHSRSFAWIYQRFEAVVVSLDGVFARIGYNRIERPVAFVERNLKGLPFDCRMCGQCVLSSTGMSCPMNCPKQPRNGPCGGVRPGGHCEVKPEMRCVWVEAWDGASRMRGCDRILEVLRPVDRRLEGSSAWLRAFREKAAQLMEARQADRSAIAEAFSGARTIEPTSAPLADEPPNASMARVRDLGLDKRVCILAGVGPLASAKAGRWMRSNVPGIHIPVSIVERLEKAEKPAAEGTSICIELMQRIREIQGVAGIHVMAYRREPLVSEIVPRSGVRKRRR